MNTDNEKNDRFKAWLGAMRLRTLPLSLSGLLLASSFAALAGAFSFPIFAFTLITGILLQILSDFANDYGDSQKNLDGEDRAGPRRSIALGHITQAQMRKAMTLVIGLILLSACALLAVSFGTDWKHWVIFIALGFSAILAAMFYTMGKNPYGYKARGEYYVFVYFGLVSVLGGFYLYTKSLANAPYFPAIAAGLFSCAVLNINNMRDMENDAKHGKYTLAIKFGERNARKYHSLLVGVGTLSWALYLFMQGGIMSLALLVLTLPLIKSTHTVYTHYESAVLDKQLRITALSASLFQIIMAIVLPILFI